MSDLSYVTLENSSDTNIKFYFISNGKTSIIKAIEFRYIIDYYGKRIFNLAFGDYVLLEDRIEDSAHSNNGDVYKVFNTVLNTIPGFFKKFPDDIMMVEGSDSRPEFVTNCRLSCTKNCKGENICKNKDRRINVYRRYVNSNYDTLSDEYSFYGGLRIGNTINIEVYLPDKKYDSVFVIKKQQL